MCAIEIAGAPVNCTKWLAVQSPWPFQNGKECARRGQTFAYSGNPNPTNQADDRVFTTRLETCDNISKQIEDYMARQNGRGSSRSRLLIRQIALANSPLGILALLLAWV